MPTIINPYSGNTNSISTSLANLGNTLFGPAALQGAVLREKNAALARENQNLPLVADALANGDVNSAIRYGVLSGLKGDNVASYNRLGVASRAPDLNDQSVTAAIVGAGGPMSSTPQGFNIAQTNDLAKSKMAIDRAAATQTAIADNAPVEVVDPTAPTGYRTVSKRDAIEKGLPLVLPAAQAEGLGKVRVLNNGAAGMSREQLQASGALPANKTPHNYIADDGKIYQTYDGTTDARSGAALPPGVIASAQGTPQQLGLTKSTQGKMQAQDIALQKLQSVSDYARSLIRPGNVGIPGYAKSVAQDATQIAGAISQNFGYTGLEDAIKNAKARAAAGGVSSSVLDSLFKYDPALPQLDTAYYALVMSAADALAGGTSKASDKDVKIMKNMLGSPNELFANPQYLNSKLDAVNEIINRLHGVNAQAFQTLPGQQTAPSAPPAAAPQAAPRAAVPWQEFFKGPQ